jgi:hypothetical protein
MIEFLAQEADWRLNLIIVPKRAMLDELISIMVIEVTHI